MLREQRRAENERVAQWKANILKELADARKTADEAQKRLDLYRAYARDLEKMVSWMKGLER